MAYIVLTLGVLMALVGLGAMATGYPVIEIERGWATVIAGAVLLSGGVVTAALGIVVRLLLGLKGTTLINAAAAPWTETPSLAPPAHPATPVQTPTMSVTALAPARLPFESAPAFAVAAPAAVAAAAGLAADRSPERGSTAAEPEPEPTYEQPEPVYEEPERTGEHSLEEAEGHPHEPEKADLSPEPEPAAHEDPRGTAPKPQPPPDEPHPLQSEAWLDQAFQAFDYEMAGSHPPAHEAPVAPHAEPDAEPPRLAEAAPEEPLLEAAAEPAHEAAAPEQPTREATLPEPVDEEAPATAPEAPSNLAVIGRYDSDGTSYVMYADGSIEAQSEAGVYRFGSMAELKAFIEG